MKKTITTLALLLGLALGATAQKGGGLFERGEMSEGSHRNSGSPMLPVNHNMDGDQPADPAPIEGGVALLFGMAVMYLTRKKDSHD
ncbi:MAG: hypothetical protein IJQ11_01790 [Bacteroidales bacterium]|nr:hypothetical protein [Bacteroidales bacterium]